MDISHSGLFSARLASSQPAGDVVVELHKTLPFPIEINRMIYSHVFSQIYGVIWDWNQNLQLTNHPRRAKSLNILQVSSTVYKEAFEVLYNGSAFKFDIKESLGPQKDIFNAKVQSGKKACLDVHCFPNEQTRYPDLTARVNRYINALVSSPRAHHLQLNVNKFAISRIAKWNTFDLLGKFEVVEIHALIQTHGFVRLTPIAIANNEATSEARAKEAMAELAMRLESRYGPVKLSARKVEGRPRHGIATDSDYWLIAKAQPKMRGFNPNFARGLERFNIRQAKAR